MAYKKVWFSYCADGNHCYNRQYYVCLSCHDGEYITGVFDEYNPETVTVNGKEVAEEEFKMWFDLAELLDSSSIPRSRIMELPQLS